MERPLPEVAFFFISDKKALIFIIVSGKMILRDFGPCIQAVDV